MSLAQKLLMGAATSVALLALPVAAATWSDNTGATTNHDVPLPTGCAAGELVLVEFLANGTATVTTPSGAVSMITQVGATATYDTFKLFGKILDATDISNGYIRCTVGAGTRASGVARRVTGNRPGLVLNTDFAVSTEVTSALATIDPANLTPAWGSARNLWIAIGTGHDGSTGITSYATGYTDSQVNVNTGAGNGNQIGSCCKFATATSDDPGAITFVTARNRLGYTVAIRPQ